MLKLKSGPLVGVTGIAVLIVLSLSGALAQEVPKWQKAAGGKFSSEVASIKPANQDRFTPPNFALDFLDSFEGPNPHGRLVAQFPLEVCL